MQNIKGILFVMVSASIFGCMPLFSALIQAEGVAPSSLLLLRAMLALPFLYLMMKVKKVDFKLQKGELLKIAAVSTVGSAITPYMLIICYDYISSGMATTLHFIYPAAVIVGCAVVYRAKIHRMQWLSAAMCCVGAWMFCSFDGEIDPIGVTLAISSGFVYASYIIALEKSGVDKIHPFKYCFYGACSCTVFMFIVSIAGGTLQLPQSLKGWLLCALSSVAIMVIAVMLFQIGVGIIGSQKSGILSTFEPITSSVIGILVFNEPFGIKSAVGTVLILLSVVLLESSGKSKQAA